MNSRSSVSQLFFGVLFSNSGYNNLGGHGFTESRAIGQYSKEKVFLPFANAIHGWL